MVPSKVVDSTKIIKSGTKSAFVKCMAYKNMERNYTEMGPLYGTNFASAK